ncbi:MAG: alpha-N-acetylglucosaminidase [Bacteroidales bacterium]|nr:alpha-N-acetylglucosaminidase [Bacteroidales bacterium]
MRKLFIAAAAVLAIVSCTDRDVRSVRSLAGRVVGGKGAAAFVFEKEPCDSDFFALSMKGGKVLVQGNNALSMAVGLNYYLKYYCNIDYGWLPSCGGAELPERLPVVEEPLRCPALVDKRFFLNYCTFGYTMPWWKWEEWERCIDWMALNGVNLPLAITGQESIWYKLWTSMGLSDEEVRSYFTGPAHLPWHRMQNIDHWGGPLPKSWLDGQLKLQQRIVQRERQLNMRPVLPAFAGHVPEGLMRLYPDAPIDTLGQWAGYPDDYRCLFLDPLSELYGQIQQKFISLEEQCYGTDHIYGLDIFNEVDSPSWEPEYLAHVSGTVYRTLQAADPDAVWLQMGWMFYYDRRHWTPERVEAYLGAVPAERQMILDYFCEKEEVWRRTNSYFGVPYIWCYLGNFGGNTFLSGPFHEVENRIALTYAEGGENFSGIGSTLEGFDCNPLMYEYVLEQAWDLPGRNWPERYADRRFGRENAFQRSAWKLLCDSVYVWNSGSFLGSYAARRPYLGKATTHTHSGIHYSNATLGRAIGLMLESEGGGRAWEFDLVNLTRQWLGNLSADIFNEWTAAYSAGDAAASQDAASRMLELVADMDSLCATQSFFLAGKWIADARSWGADPAEADYFERNARNLITTWSDAGMTLNDYALRDWNGVLGTYSLRRWESFFEAAASGGEDWYSDWLSSVKAFERAWGEEMQGNFAAEPSGDPVSAVRLLYSKYSR